jgi:hypothetical protein
MLRCAGSKFFLRPVRPTPPLKPTPPPPGPRAPPPPQSVPSTTCTKDMCVTMHWPRRKPRGCQSTISGRPLCVSSNGCRCQTKLFHVTLLTRHCHIVNTPGTVCFVLKLAQASLGCKSKVLNASVCKIEGFLQVRSLRVRPSSAWHPSPDRPPFPPQQFPSSLPPTTYVFQ